MLSYRHAFHAGNHADVLKHLILQQVLQYLHLKEKPYFYLDTHAGAGFYALTEGFALKNAEYRNGIARLWNTSDLPQPLAQFLRLIQTFNPEGALTHYPGSPAIAHALQRPVDRLALCELHPTDFSLLTHNFERKRKVQLLQQDGFTATRALLPPMEKRGVILCDPSYELKEDYERVVEMVMRAHKKFSTGIYLLWYPVVERVRVDQLCQLLRRSEVRDIQRFELNICPDTVERGMTGSGMIVVNAPWSLAGQMSDVLPVLQNHLEVEPGAGSYVIERLTKE